MKNRIDFCALKKVVALAVTALALSAPASRAQSPQSTARLAPAHPGASVARTASLTAKAPSKLAKPTASALRPRATAQKTPLSAPALKLETKEAARQVVRDDQAARQRLVGVDAGHRIAPNIMKNLYEPLVPPRIEMGDRPARSLGLCGDGKNRRFAELDSKTVAALLPEFSALRPRTICARRGVLIADYAFK